MRLFEELEKIGRRENEKRRSGYKHTLACPVLISSRDARLVYRSLGRKTKARWHEGTLVRRKQRPDRQLLFKLNINNKHIRRILQKLPIFTVLPGVF